MHGASHSLPKAQNRLRVGKGKWYRFKIICKISEGESRLEFTPRGFNVQWHHALNHLSSLRVLVFPYPEVVMHTESLTHRAVLYAFIVTHLLLPLHSAAIWDHGTLPSRNPCAAFLSADGLLDTLPTYCFSESGSFWLVCFTFKFDYFAQNPWFPVTVFSITVRKAQLNGSLRRCQKLGIGLLLL